MKSSKNNNYLNEIQGKRIKECMKMFKLTGKFIAEKLNYTPQHISYVLNGKRNLTLEMAISLADLFSEYSGDRVMNDYASPSPYSENINTFNDSESNTHSFFVENKIDYKYLLGETDYMFFWDNLEPPKNQTPDYLFKEGIKALLHHYGYDMKINMCPDITLFKNINPNSALIKTMSETFIEPNFTNEIVNISTGEKLQLSPAELYQLFQDITKAITSIIERNFEKQKWLNYLAPTPSKKNDVFPLFSDSEFPNTDFLNDLHPPK